jgi:hypothetical protein
MPHAVSGDADEQQIAQQLTETEGRLVDEYAGRNEVTEDRVRGLFRQVAQRFAGASVRTFLPILIERAVRRELGG